MQKALIYVLLFFLYSCDSQDTKNLEIFANVYGYVKYFHPSDEASQIDWNRFSIYGASKIIQCKTKEEVVKTLNDLFKPIAPSIYFSTTESKRNFKYNNPNTTEEDQFIYWQHLGVGFGMESKLKKLNSTVYESRRVKVINKICREPLFDYQPKFGESITKELHNGIYCHIPIVLYYNENGTYPKSNILRFNALQEELKNCMTNPESLSVRLGNVINSYNVFQHFYPYFDVVDVNWQKELSIALKRSFFDKNAIDHLITLQKFTSPLKDGHISVNYSLVKNYMPPISWEWVNNKLVITEIYDQKINLNVGDVITAIDGVKSSIYFKEIYSRISASTEGWLQYRANIISLYGALDSQLSLTANNRNIIVPRNIKPYELLKKKREQEIKYKQISDSIYYINLDVIEMDTINEIMPQLENCTSIIFDLRGYPNSNDGIIRHLLMVNDTVSNWMQVPRIVYPDQDNIIGYDEYGWSEIMKAKKPYLGDKNIVFITDGQAISYAESVMCFIEGYNIGTIIGQPTAGTNGNVNGFYLPDGYLVRWTGLKVLKLNGDQHHGIGILPDIYVDKTIQGIIDGRDEFLDKALEIAKNRKII